jgi:hypothetical protein
MRRTLCLLLLPLLLPACDSSPKITREESFGPAKVRLHPTFTQVRDWTTDGKPDGVEAVVELLDSFGDPTRGSGTFVFEVYDYRPNDPNPANKRLGEPWIVKLETRDDQQAKWSPALRAYTFQLPGKLRKDKTYVLDVTFETAGGANRPGGGRLFDRLVIEPPADVKKPEHEVKRGGLLRPGH